MKVIAVDSGRGPGDIRLTEDMQIGLRDEAEDGDERPS